MSGEKGIGAGYGEQEQRPVLEKTGVDAKDDLRHDTFTAIEQSDAFFAEVGKKVLAFGEEDFVDERKGGELKAEFVSLAGKIDELPKALSREVKRYFDHDVRRFHRGVVSRLEILAGHEKFSHLTKDILLEQWSRISKNWEVHRLAMQGVATREKCGEDHVCDEVKAMDRNKPVARLVNVVKYLSTEYIPAIGKITEVEIDSNVQHLKNSLRIEAPHGIIANLMNNCIANASDASVGAEHLRVHIYIDGDDLVFELYDDGKGMGGEVLQQIFKKGKTFGKIRGTGLGLAYADKRMAQSGGSVCVASRERVSNGELSEYGQVQFNPPFLSSGKRRKLKLKESLSEYSTVFHVRAPIIH